MPKIKNIIIFVSIGAVLVLTYFFFIRTPAPEDNLVVSSTSGSLEGAAAMEGEVAAAREFLTLLLSVRNIRLDDSVFSDAGFKNLDGSHSITLVQDGSEGRPNPFAPLGSDAPKIAPAGNTPLTTQP